MDFRVTSYTDWNSGEKPSCVVVPRRESTIDFSSLLVETEIELVKAAAECGAFKGKEGESFFLPVTRGSVRGILLLGVGPDSEKLRRAVGKFVDALRAHRIERIVIDRADAAWPLAAFVEGLELGQYRFDRYKKIDPDAFMGCVNEVVLASSTPELLETDAQACRYTADVCSNANWARDLGNAASNDMTPTQLALEAQSVAQKFKLEYDCLDAGRMAELGMNALLGVARGSKEPPKLIVLAHQVSRDLPTIAIVGKGVTFDTGGISIKPADSMHEMKYDMCGAAAVLGAMRTVGQTKPNVNVICVVPSSENCVDGNAQKPGDIVRAYNGKTIEVHNTDAEGRLILCDALAYTVDHYAPTKIVDMATLTGGVIVALGHYAAGVMATDDGLYAGLEAAAAVTGERVWRFPLWDDYSKMMEGEHADLCNIGPPRQASAIQGGSFLKEFVGDTPWAHVDIAGTAWGAKGVSYLDTKFASGYGVRLLSEWIRNEAKAKG